MTNPVKALSKLAPASEDPLSASMPKGGPPGVLPEDVAHALSKANVSNFGEAIGRAKYALSSEARMQCWLAIRTQVSRYLRSIDICSRELTDSLSSLLMYEYIDEPKCEKCQGVGERTYQKRWQQCPTCKGTGARELSSHRKAAKTGIPQKTWHRTWEARYQEMAKPIIEAEQECLAKLRHQLKSV